MFFSKSIETIAVIGAGTMGSGIAFTAAQAGYPVVLFDVFEAGLEKARSTVAGNLQFLLSKQKITEEESGAIAGRIKYTTSQSDCIADLVIEAAVEDMTMKKEIFNWLAAQNDKDAILASNTSSLSITELQQGITNPGRIAGMHFFNPAQVMKLVEVVKGADTDNSTAKALVKVAEKMGKTPVVCKDSPGFIVNRVARPYYLEAMYIAEQGYASFMDIDNIMEASGFKMGPFRLMDMIGMDINLAVSESVYDAFKQEARFKPNNLQIEKVKAGNLGKKTGSGFYDWTENGSKA